MDKLHDYAITVEWTGNVGLGTSAYTSYKRSHTISSENKNPIEASSDPAFRGDRSKYNPEELLVASLSSCHMLWYLHLCSEAGVVVLEYSDNATGTLMETKSGGGYFTEVILYPVVIVADAKMINKANELHREAHKLCFIARSVNFPVHHKPTASTTEI